MTYTVTIRRRAAKALATLPVQDFERVRDAIRALGETPQPAGCKKLVGRNGWRIRVGRYRVIYEVADRALVVLVLDVGDWKDVYG